jgi:hypothetical protein
VGSLASPAENKRSRMPSGYSAESSMCGV